MIVIKELSETKYTFSDVHSLIKVAYKQRADEGIHFRALTETTEELEKRINDNSGIVFVALDDSTNELLGTGSVLFCVDKDTVPYAGLVLAAVLPKAQGQGIGSLLRIRQEEYAKEHGCVYISSSTAMNATSSIRYHLKTGAKKYGFISARDSEYYSVYFRKYLSTTKKKSGLYCTMHYFFSKAKTLLMFHENGEKKMLGKIVYSVFK